MTFEDGAKKDDIRRHFLQKLHFGCTRHIRKPVAISVVSHLILLFLENPITCLFIQFVCIRMRKSMLWKLEISKYWKLWEGPPWLSQAYGSQGGHNCPWQHLSWWQLSWQQMSWEHLWETGFHHKNSKAEEAVHHWPIYLPWSDVFWPPPQASVRPVLSRPEWCTPQAGHGQLPVAPSLQAVTVSYPT